jgi:site-specific recombinase XerD
MLKRRSRQAGVKISPHMMRRAFAFRWLSEGGSTPGLLAVAGWADASMAVRYTKAVASTLAEAEHRRIFTSPEPRKRIIPPRG